MYEWNWEARESNLKNANAIKPSQIVLLDKEKPLIEVQGTELYTANLDECSCQDFKFARNGAHACKHILRLAIELGIINSKGNTPEQQYAADKQECRDAIAMAYGKYHLFRDPIMSDKEYDTLKSEYKQKYGDL